LVFQSRDLHGNRGSQIVPRCPKTLSRQLRTSERILRQSSSRTRILHLYNHHLHSSSEIYRSNVTYHNHNHERVRSCFQNYLSFINLLRDSPQMKQPQNSNHTLPRCAIRAIAVAHYSPYQILQVPRMKLHRSLQSHQAAPRTVMTLKN